jgi:nitroimidazol reductase NimA-like FMN-containing flavoprotein (pyridoxamine 5'-phosphate oxidase superfamily)
MTKEECDNALTRVRLGRLGCARENQPYVVPIYFVYRYFFLYGFTMPGQKVEWMRANPRVCVEVDEMEEEDRWMSIVILGRYEEMSDTPQWEDERLLVYTLLQQHEGWWEPGGAPHAHPDPGQGVTPVFYRIRIDSVTGRRASPDRGTVAASGE